MRKMRFGLSFLSCLSLSLVAVSARAQIRNDGADIPECKGVTDVCMRAKVSAPESQSGKPFWGYQPGDNRLPGEGLWKDCVLPLANGAHVAGVTGVPKTKAQACFKAAAIAQSRQKTN